MKPSAITYLIITTLFLISAAIFASEGFPFSWVCYLIVFGPALLVFSGVKILKDDYTTDKTSDDFYEIIF